MLLTDGWCFQSGKMYNLKTNPPPDEEIAARLVQREADTAEKVADQLFHHTKNTAAVCGVFAEQVVSAARNPQHNLISRGVSEGVLVVSATRGRRWEGGGGQRRDLPGGRGLALQEGVYRGPDGVGFGSQLPGGPSAQCCCSA